MKTDQELKEAGFTLSGVKRYQSTVGDYANVLYKKSLNFGDAAKAEDMPREVTHDHVRSSANVISNTFGTEKTSKWWILCQVSEYVLTAISAYAAANLSKDWGTPVFVVAVVLAGVLVATRISNAKSK
ncbi:hypothetical protein [Vibrio atlanticus]|uniref:Uncharacterized protein n=1 Tax=Vibrio atlanticus TaxID=693153 RepID=A0A1C3J575_9VIBR|nr:hypothetical protein [Vibrio atlanticus]SBS68815.1 hypothetical protein VAT7223_04399 [Vibrio atlanticus]